MSNSKDQKENAGPAMMIGSSSVGYIGTGVVKTKECSVVLERLRFEECSSEEEEGPCSPSSNSPDDPGGALIAESDTIPSLLQCCVPGCSSINSLLNSTGRKEPTVTYHWFPDDEVKRMEWFNAIKNPNLNIRNYTEASVCSSHFESVEFSKAKGSGLRTLNPDAVPSINIPKENRLSMDAISVSSDESYGSRRSESRIEPPSDTEAEKNNTGESRGENPNVPTYQAEHDGKSSLGDKSTETTSNPPIMETNNMGKPSDSADVYYYQSKPPIVLFSQTSAVIEERSRLRAALIKNASDPSFQFSRPSHQDHSYHYSVNESHSGYRNILPKPLVPNTQSTPTASQSSTMPLPVNSVTVRMSNQLYILPEQLSGITGQIVSISEVVSPKVPVLPMNTRTVPIAPLNSRTAPVGKADSHKLPSKNVTLISKALITPKGLEVPELPDLYSDIETAHTGGTDFKNPHLPTLSRQKAGLTLRSHGSKPSNATNTTANAFERKLLSRSTQTAGSMIISNASHIHQKASQHTLASKLTQTDPPNENCMKQRMIEFERKAENLELRLARAALKHAETMKHFKIVRQVLARSKKSIAKHKETIEHLKKDVEGQQVQNRILREGLEKTKPKPRPVRVYMPTDMVDSETSNLQGKTIRDGKITTFVLSRDEQHIANNQEEGGSNISPTCASKSKRSKKSNFSCNSELKRSNPSSFNHPFKKPCFSLTSNISKSPSNLNVASTLSEDGTIVYYLKPTAKVKLKTEPPPKQSMSVQIDESEFRTIETVTDEGDIAYHLLRSPQKTRTHSRDLAQNAGYQINEVVKAVEVILSMEEGLIEK